jgi:endoglucanase
MRITTSAYVLGCQNLSGHLKITAHKPKREMRFKNVFGPLAVLAWALTPLLFAPMSNALAPPVSTAVDTEWSIVNGGIFYKNETLFQIKGVNFFGFETCDYCLHGLWAHPLTFYLDFLQQHKFNIIRVPFSQDWVLNSFETRYPSPTMIVGDPSLQGLKTVEIMDKLFEECHKRGIFILLDMHRLPCEAQSHEVWYSLDGKGFTSETFIESWRKILDRYAKNPNFHGIDLLNEPRGIAAWGSDPTTSWNMFVDYAYKNLADYQGMFYVEGTEWGRSFIGMREHPINVPDNRIVFSPHVYGPSVVGNVDMNVQHLHADWQNIFGFLIPERKACVIGEFGGRFEGADRVWQDLFVDYLLSIRTAGIYWSLNPNSIDSGGLFADDWTTPKWDKLELLDRLQPYPTIVSFDSPPSVITLKSEQTPHLRGNMTRLYV